MEKAFESTQIGLLRGWGWWGIPAVVVPILLLVLARAALDFHATALAAAGAAGLVSWIAALWIGYRAGGGQKPQQGHLRIDERVVTFQGELLVEREAIRTAVLVPSENRPFVAVEGKGAKSFKLQVNGQEEGLAVLRALGFAVEQRKIEATMATSMGYSGKSYVAIVLAGLAAVAAGATMGVMASAAVPMALPIALVLAVATMFTAVLWPTKLSIGADGVHVRWMFRERFMAYDDIAEVLRDGGGLSLRGHDGRAFMVIPKHNRYALSAEAAEERIREALALRRTPGSRVARAALARGGRRLDAWLEALRSLERAAEGGLRAAPVLLDDLWQVLEDPRAAPSARAGAAVALGPRLDQAGRDRLRIAAEAIAAPQVRIAIESVADADEERLAEALAALEDESESAGEPSA